jgi:hypothetical protein
VKARRSILNGQAWKTTTVNEFGLFKRFWTLEEQPPDPDYYASSTDLLDDETPEEDPAEASTNAGTKIISNPYFPFPNFSSYSLGKWFWDDEDKSVASFHRLLATLTQDDFKPQEPLQANWAEITASLGFSQFDDSGNANSEAQWIDDGMSWQTAEVELEVPFNSTSTQPGTRIYSIPGFRFRPLVSVIHAKLLDKAANDYFHVVPCDLQWQRPGSEEAMRVYGELYHSRSFLDAYQEVQVCFHPFSAVELFLTAGGQALPPEPTEDDLPRYVVALMFTSDDTMLTSFGNAKLWPAYMLFGNESKHRRGKMSLKLFEEVAYFLTVGPLSAIFKGSPY